MPKAITPLTDSQCKNLALPAKGINQLSDGHGLSLQADSKGGKYWRLRYYHPHTKKREEIRLGIIERCFCVCISPSFTFHGRP